MGLLVLLLIEAVARLVELGRVAYVVSQNADGLHRLSGVQKYLLYCDIYISLSLYIYIYMFI